jgi:uncharacterized protein YyaL (SSP411 family)
MVKCTWRKFLALLFVVGSGVSCSDKREDGNRLKDSGSPYLREHADNPVDWFEWSPEALQKAKKENKPLIISIGYAACHWCHVMEEESFMDTAVARFMNENFVAIKIDREERPDIDQIYLDAAQLISGNSGWPLNAFALPDGKPFFAATYFPRENWLRLLKQVSKAYKDDYDNLVRQADAVTNGIRSNQVIAFSDSSLFRSKQAVNNIFESWDPHFDYTKGGLMGDMKFPLPVIWEFVLQHYYLTGQEKSLQLVTTTLDNMLNGGIYDPLGGGFARYATDEDWLVPHFEKMLYDNGQLVSLYSHAYQVTGDTTYAQAIEKTLQFIKEQMTSPEGGFYSSLNADSEGEEGKYYVWTLEEIKSLLDGEAADVFSRFYNISDSGNWEKGKNILYTKQRRADFAKLTGLDRKELDRILNGSEKILFKHRQKRVPPSLDNKILLSWNAIMLQGFVDAYFSLGKPEYLEIALRNGNFLVKNFYQSDGSLVRNFMDGQSSIDAFLEDYALLARAFIQLYQATFDNQWLEKAASITRYAIENFRDGSTGLYHYTSAKAEDLIVRRTEIADNVIPSSNAVLAEALFMLGEYYGDENYTKLSESMLSKIIPLMTEGEPYYARWATLVGLITYQPYQIAIAGKDARNKAMAMQKHYIPLAIYMGGNEEDLPLLENKLVADRTVIYVCRNRVCKLPEEEPSKALAQIQRYPANPL